MHHVAERARRLFNPIVHRIKALQCTALKPALKILGDLGKRFKIVREHEAFHARALGDQFPTVIERLHRGLVLRDRTTEHESRLLAQLAHDRIEGFAAHIVKKDIDAVGSGLSQGARKIRLGLAVNHHVITHIAFQPIGFITGAG